MTEEELYLLQFSSRQMAESRMYDDYAACGINGEVSADEGEASKVVSCQHPRSHPNFISCLQMVI